MTTLYIFKKILTSGVVVACLSVAVQVRAACPTTAGRFVASGVEVIDSQTGLIWQRCSAGQSWSGSTCTGSVIGYIHEAALSYAKIQNPANSPTGWRLPNVKELSSLADKGCQNPAIDSTAFPATPSNRYWTSSPQVGNSDSAWLVYFNSGIVLSDTYRSSGIAQVRLVRASQ